MGEKRSAPGLGSQAAQPSPSTPNAYVEDARARGPYPGVTVSDRRRYPRVQANVIYRPAGARIFHHKRNTQDISLGGMRVFADEQFPLGMRLDLDVLVGNGEWIRCWAEVVWSVELNSGGPAKFDIGLRFIDMSPSDAQRLASVLAR